MKIEFIAGFGPIGGADARSHDFWAGTLGIDTIGEGVETAHQRQLLFELGCAYGQGYLFGRPRPAQATAALLQTA